MAGYGTPQKILNPEGGPNPAYANKMQTHTGHNGMWCTRIVVCVFLFHFDGVKVDVFFKYKSIPEIFFILFL